MKGKTNTNALSFFVSMSTLESIHKHLNIPLGRGSGVEKTTDNLNNESDDIQGEAIDEEVIDEEYD